MVARRDFDCVRRSNAGQYTLRPMNTPQGILRLAASVLLGLFLFTASPSSHEIPVEVLVQAFVHPEGQRLVLIVRVPLGAMRDIRFPATPEGFLDLPRAENALREAAITWVASGVEVFENDRRLEGYRLAGVRASLPSDRSFVSYARALERITGPPLPDTTLVWDQALLDTLIEYPIASDRSDFSIRMGAERLGLRVMTALRFVPPDGAERAFEFTGDAGTVRLDPRWHQAALSFVRLGFRHILDGIDHLLFLLCLVIPFRRFRPLVLVVTAFTVAHSVTLIASAYGVAPDALWFPALVETLIAMSIVYMALENIVMPGGARRRWIITFAFGLVHGFGFSFALRESLQFAGSHLLTSLLAFNIGVELGQLLVLAITIPLLHALFRYVVAERLGTIIVCVVVAHTAWHWMVDRGSALSAYEWPAIDAAFLAAMLWWVMLFVGIGGTIWAVMVMLGQQKTRTRG
jgi:hypothetical protein